MKSVFSAHAAVLGFFLVMMAEPQPLLAYVGPGAGLSAIGAFLAVVVGILSALFGFLWYPLKRILKNRRRRKAGDPGGEAE